MHWCARRFVCGAQSVSPLRACGHTVVFNDGAQMRPKPTVSSRQNLPCFGCVKVHLLDQGIEIGELYFVSQFLNEIDMNMPAIDILIEIENMHFKQWLRPINCWARSKTCDAVQGFIFQPHNAGREYTHKGNLTAVRIDVCGGEPQFATKMITLDDFARHSILSPQQRRCASKVP